MGKTRFDGKYIRTDGWRHQSNYDNLLADLDVSSLSFLKYKYNRDIRYFRNHHDLNDEDNAEKYKLLLQRKSMITQELEHRLYDTYASPSQQDRVDYFDAEMGIVLDEFYNPLYGVAFSEDEDDYEYSHTDNTASPLVNDINEEDETDYTYYKYHTRKGVYENWNYTEDLDD